MTLEIPLRSDVDNYSLTVDLDGIVYQIEIDYNFRMDRWHMSVLDAEGVRLYSGIPILTDWDNTSRYVGETLPAGAFVPVDESGNHQDAGHDDLGDPVKLTYTEAA